MKVKLNDDGVLMGADGKPLKIGDETIEVEGALTQPQVDTVVKQRLERQKDTYEKEIKVLQEAVKANPALQEMLNSKTTELDATKKKLEVAERDAEEKVQTQVKTLGEQKTALETALATERQARVHDQVSAQIVSRGADRFLAPEDDIVPRLLRVHRREPMLGDDGKALDGRFQDLFEVEVADDKGKVAKKWLPVDQALDALAADKRLAHYRRPSGTAGTGGASSRASGGVQKPVKDMTLAEKTAFIKDNGPAAYQALLDGTTA